MNIEVGQQKREDHQDLPLLSKLRNSTVQPVSIDTCNSQRNDAFKPYKYKSKSDNVNSAKKAGLQIKLLLNFLE